MKECITHFSCDCIVSGINIIEAKIKRLEAENTWLKTKLKERGEEHIEHLNDKLKLRERVAKLRAAVQLIVKYDPSLHDDKTCAGFMTVNYCFSKKTLAKDDEMEGK